jgi:hypothetical protein
MRTFKGRSSYASQDAIPAFCSKAVYGRKRRSPKLIASLVVLTGLGLLFFQGDAGSVWGMF